MDKGHRVHPLPSVLRRDRRGARVTSANDFAAEPLATQRIGTSITTLENDQPEEIVAALLGRARARCSGSTCRSSSATPWASPTASVLSGASPTSSPCTARASVTERRPETAHDSEATGNRIRVQGLASRHYRSVRFGCAGFGRFCVIAYLLRKLEATVAKSVAPDRRCSDSTNRSARVSDLKSGDIRQQRGRDLRCGRPGTTRPRRRRKSFPTTVSTSREAR